jgi:hypothetical protein
VRRWLVALAALGVVVAFVTFARSRSLDVHVQDIESVAIDPYPEGPPGPTFTRGPRPSAAFYYPLEQLEPFIPDPLPNTAWQGLNCGMGGNLIVTLRDGDTVIYGPCRRPESINDLWAHMVDIPSDGKCGSDCGPGGPPGAG